MEQKRSYHVFGPVADKNSRVLVLGSFPSVKSREIGFFYMYPQNRFWKVLSELLNEDFVHQDSNGKANLLLRHRIALYDVVESCRIIGSKDQTIEDVVFADIEGILKNTSVERIYLNGSKAFELFLSKFPELSSISTKLPSTSSANASYGFDRLVEEWKIILGK